ncbi:MAG: type II toxin-antitoxin system RelE/ParE family toxin [Pseudoxanthomonas sp.]
MLPSLEWKQTAREDLLAIVDYISDDNPDAAQALKNGIEARVADLPRFPQMCRIGRLPHTREMVVRSNYIVVYSEDTFAVNILRILHSAQLWPPVVDDE